MPVPNNGAFRIYPRSVAELVSGNFAQTGVGAPPPIVTQDALTTYYNSEVDGGDATAPRLWQGFDSGAGLYVPYIGTYELRLSPKSVVVFDPLGTPIVLSVLDADFPNGFVANQMHIWWNGFYTTRGRGKQLTNWKLKQRGTTVRDETPLDGVSGDGILTSDEFGGNAISNLYWGLFQVLGTSMGYSGTIADAAVGGTPSGASFRTDLIYLEGVYNLLYFTVTMAPQNAGPGGEITVTGTNLTVLDELSISWYDALAPSTDWLDPLIPNIVGGIVIPRSMILTWTSTTIVFRIPYSLIPYGGKRLMIRARQISGTTFTGYTLIGNVNVQLTDGSGIYTLVPGKTNDTYYDRAVGPNATIDLKIPDPLGKTGFFNG